MSTPTNRQRARKVAVYAILRLELDVAQPDLAVAVTAVLPTPEEAELEVQRLNRLNADKKCRYVWRVTRFFPDGRHPNDKTDGQ